MQQGCPNVHHLKLWEEVQAKMYLLGGETNWFPVEP